MVKQQTTGLGLSADKAFMGLVDHGLFSENLLSCFTSEGLSGHVTKNLISLTTKNNENRLADFLKKGKNDFIHYESLYHTSAPGISASGRFEDLRTTVRSRLKCLSV